MGIEAPPRFAPPPTAQPEPRRDQILRAALECFAARGFKGTTTREVAARVGITEAALYRHFPSKEALYAAIVDAKMAMPPPMQRVQAAAAAGDDRAVFSGLADAMLAGAESDPSFIRILLYTALEGHALAQPFFETRVRSLREFLAGYIARRTREGAFRALDPVLGARAFLGMVFDFVLARDVFQQREAYPHARAEAVDAFVSVFLEGVRARRTDHD